MGRIIVRDAKIPKRKNKMTSMYRVYDKNRKENDLALEDFFAEAAAQAHIAQRAKEGRDCEAIPFTPQCTWGSAYPETQCKNEAVWFKAGWGGYGAVCAEHLQDWMTGMISRKEAERLEQNQGRVPDKPVAPGKLAGFWFKE